MMIHIHRHSKMIIIVKPIHICPPIANIFFMRALGIYCHNKFPVFNTKLLIIIIMLYTRSLDLFILHNLNFVFYLPFSPTTCSW